MSTPIKRFGAGAIQIAVWENETKEGGKYNTISLQRSYKDKNDEWKSSGSFRVNDIPKAILTLQKTYEYIMLKDQTSEEATSNKALAAAL